MQRSISSRHGFTLLEIILALLIAVIVIAVSIPSVTSALNGSPLQKDFEAFDAMAREAHQRSVAERRNYVLVWGREGLVRMRPEAPENREEAEGLQRREIAKDEKLVLHLPAALLSRGQEPDAIWTFWADGVCEPARVEYKGRAGAWTAVYAPFTAVAEVRYE